MLALIVACVWISDAAGATALGRLNAPQVQVVKVATLSDPKYQRDIETVAAIRFAERQLRWRGIIPNTIQFE